MSDPRFTRHVLGPIPANSPPTGVLLHLSVAQAERLAAGCRYLAHTLGLIEPGIVAEYLDVAGAIARQLDAASAALSPLSQPASPAAVLAPAAGDVDADPRVAESTAAKVARANGQTPDDAGTMRWLDFEGGSDGQ